jgi:hypothetical protein
MKFSTAMECAIAYPHDLIRGIDRLEYDSRNFSEANKFPQFTARFNDVHIPRHVHVLHAGEVSHFPLDLIQAIEIGSQMYQLWFNYLAVRRLHFDLYSGLMFYMIILSNSYLFQQWRKKA